MNKHLISLVVFCAIVFAAFTVAAFAFGPDDSPPVNKERSVNRKNGDMIILWYGSRGYHRSGRTSSVGNRSFRGGGLHGGK